MKSGSILTILNINWSQSSTFATKCNIHGHKVLLCSLSSRDERYHRSILF